MKEEGVRYCFANWRRQEIERRKRDFNNDDDFKVYL